jgi:hypothetical protein
VTKHYTGSRLDFEQLGRETGARVPTLNFSRPKKQLLDPMLVSTRTRAGIHQHERADLFVRVTRAVSRRCDDVWQNEFAVMGGTAITRTRFKFIEPYLPQIPSPTLD